MPPINTPSFPTPPNNLPRTSHSPQPACVQACATTTVTRSIASRINPLTEMSQKAPTVKPDFDTDVLWKPVRLGNRTRTMSMDSNESGESSRRTSINEGGPEVAPRARKLSFTEMIFGAPGKGGFSWGQGNLHPHGEKKESITNDERFKELMKRESMILNDEGAFSTKDYRKH